MKKTHPSYSAPGSSSCLRWLIELSVRLDLVTILWPASHLSKEKNGGRGKHHSLVKTEAIICHSVDFEKFIQFLSPILSLRQIGICRKMHIAISNLPKPYLSFSVITLFFYIFLYQERIFSKISALWASLVVHISRLGEFQIGTHP